MPLAPQDPTVYGDRIAELYDDLHGSLDPTAAVERLFALADGEAVLELGIGSGRVALPLARRGLEVHGIDPSQSMVDRLRAQPGGAEIPVTIGDFADVETDGSFGLVFVAFNTFFALLTQEDQLRCFRNVSDHLAPGGRLVIDGFVPDVTRFDRGQRVGASRVEGTSGLVELAEHDLATQRVNSQLIVFAEHGTRMYPVAIRYAWPSELDLMAQLAGLELESRTGGWDSRTFDSGSTQHISVYRKP